jgi:hypothetical protein
MADNNLLNNLSEEDKNTGLKIFDLIFSRVLKSVYLNLSQDQRKNMENIFLSENDKEKEDFIKKHIPNFKVLFDKEAKKIEVEIKDEIKNRF